MTKLMLKIILDRELSRINREIDRKISLGKSYRKEARIHRELLAKMNNLARQKNISAVL